INLGVTAQKPARNKRRKDDALPAAGEQWIIARIEHYAAKDLALHKRTFLRKNELRGAGRHVENIHILQCVTQGRVRVNSLPAERQASIQKPRLSDCQNEVLALRAVLETQPEFLAAAGKRRPVEQIKITLGKLCEAHQFVHGAEAAAEAE